MTVRCFTLCALLSTSIPAAADLDYWPTGGWRVSTPEEQGMDSAALADLMATFVERPFNIHSLTVVRHGYLVLDACFAPYTPDTPHDVASVTKSVTATLIGIAIDKGFIKSADEPVLTFFPGRTIANLDDRKRAVSLRHLLTMSSGIKCVTEPGEVTLMEMLATPDWAQYVLDLPMEYDPGAKFVYSSPGVHLLSAILHQATGMSALEFAKQHLFGPLGITDVGWPTDPQGRNHGWGDLRLRPHDMAKLGLLYLQGGQWNGQQVLSRDWVTAATTACVETSDPSFPNYGYLWWLSDGRRFNALGRGCQRIYAMPEQDLLVVTTAGVDGPAVKRITDLPQKIAAAAESNAPLPAKPAAAGALASRIQQASTRKPDPLPVPKPPRTARRISGKTFAMDANPVGLAQFSLSFPAGNEARLILGFKSSPLGNGSMDLAVGLDNVWRITPNGRNGLPAAAKGAWKDDNAFVADLNEIANINQWRITATFDKDSATVILLSLSGLGQYTLTGRLEK